jgi:hypothetical protein
VKRDRSFKPLAAGGRTGEVKGACRTACPVEIKPLGADILFMFHHHGYSSAVAPLAVAHARVRQRDLLALRGAEEAPLCKEAAALLVGAEEVRRQLHQPAPATVEDGALRNPGDARELLHSAREHCNGCGEEVVSLLERLKMGKRRGDGEAGSSNVEAELPQTAGCVRQGTGGLKNSLRCCAGMGRLF